MLWFTFEDDPVGLEVHVYRATEYEGDPVEYASGYRSSQETGGYASDAET